MFGNEKLPRDIPVREGLQANPSPFVRNSLFLRYPSVILKITEHSNILCLSITCDRTLPEHYTFRRNNITSDTQ